MVRGAGVEDEWVNNGDLSGGRVDRIVMDTSWKASVKALRMHAGWRLRQIT